MPAPKYIWFTVTKDEYEFPVIMADTAAELAQLTGKPLASIKGAVWEIENGRRKFSRYRRVKLDEVE